MSQFGNLYAQYYDLLYSDKEYDKEVEYIHKLIRSNTDDAESILDMGCGTGRHAELLCDKGYRIHGIDLSESMLRIAETRRKGKEDKLRFSQFNIQDLAMDETFDVVVSLFHVISYQNSNTELIKAFEVAKNHLKPDGIFVFDFWYGPAVLTDLPVTKIKRLENDSIKVTRISAPTLHPDKNIVDVNYDVFIEDKENQNIIEKKELHKMRYFFDTELEMICEKVGFGIENKYEWMSEKYPDFDSWYAVWIVS